MCSTIDIYLICMKLFASISVFKLSIIITGIITIVILIITIMIIMNVVVAVENVVNINVQGSHQIKLIN